MGACGGKKKITKEDQVLRDAFDKVDKDKSGYIEKAELILLLNEIAKDLCAGMPNQIEIDEAMKIIDINKDGKINFAEYKVFLEFTTFLIQKFVQTALKEQNEK